MGYRIIAEAAGIQVKPDTNADGVIEIDDPTWHGYLANITPVEFEERFAAIVPHQHVRPRISRRATAAQPIRSHASIQPAPTRSERQRSIRSKRTFASSASVPCCKAQSPNNHSPRWVKSCPPRTPATPLAV